MKMIMVAGLLAGMVHAEMVVQDRPPAPAPIGSGIAMEVNPRQRSGFYSHIMDISSRFTLGTFTEVDRYDRNNERLPLVTVGPQIGYHPKDTITIFVRPAKALGDNVTPQKTSRLSITAGVLVGAGEIAKGVHRFFHRPH